MNFNTVTEFENQIAEFFGATYAVAVDSCTHGIELSIATYYILDSH
jgi:dTDP-4-amino-4,6-dideoxygalactose transaminase